MEVKIPLRYISPRHKIQNSLVDTIEIVSKYISNDGINYVTKKNLFKKKNKLATKWQKNHFTATKSKATEEKRNLM